MSSYLLKLSPMGFFFNLNIKLFDKIQLQTNVITSQLGKPTKLNKWMKNMICMTIVTAKIKDFVLGKVIFLFQ